MICALLLKIFLLTAVISVPNLVETMGLGDLQDLHPYTPTAGYWHRIKHRMLCCNSKRVTAIQCNGTDLPSFSNANTMTPHTGLFSYDHDVTYVCDSGGYRFEDGDVITTVTCSIAGWIWNPIVTSCGRMLTLCYIACLLYHKKRQSAYTHVSIEKEMFLLRCWKAGISKGN